MAERGDATGPTRIVFHGANAASFAPGFADRLGLPAVVTLVPDDLSRPEERAAVEAADVLVTNRFAAAGPQPRRLGLLHVPAAGFDGIDLAAVPDSAVVCNCFGHEAAIAEYVMAALLGRVVPLADADRDLRQGLWTWWAGALERVHGELAGTTIGLLGFGHIGKAIARRAKAFDMRVVAANRSPVAPSDLVDEAIPLDELPRFFAAADAFVVSLPLADETRGLVGARAFAAMRPHALVMNVGRGPVIDEAALFEALRDERIGGAVIDTWYRYPTAEDGTPLPSSFPFQDLRNVVMTPHMSGWTAGTVARRQGVIADNVRARMAGRECSHVVRPARA